MEFIISTSSGALQCTGKSTMVQLYLYEKSAELIHMYIHVYAASKIKSWSLSGE